VSLLRRQVIHLACLVPPARFAFVRDSSTGQAAVMEGVVLANPTSLGGVAVEVFLPGTRRTGRSAQVERTEWSGLVYVMPLDV